MTYQYIFSIDRKNDSRVCVHTYCFVIRSPPPQGPPSVLAPATAPLGQNARREALGELRHQDVGLEIKIDDQETYCLSLPRACIIKFGLSQAALQLNSMTIREFSQCGQTATAAMVVLEFPISIITLSTGGHSTQNLLPNIFPVFVRLVGAISAEKQIAYH